MTTRFKAWHGILIAGAVIVLGLGLSSTMVFAAVLPPPEQICCDSSGNLLRTTVESNSLDTSQGVDLSSPTPSTQPPGSPPLPRFSGINAPVWVSENGATQVADDLILKGLNDVRGGFTNSKIVSQPPAALFGPPIQVPQPLFIYDNLNIYGNGAAEPGNLSLNGNINNPTAGAPVTVNDREGLEVTNNLSVGGKITATGIGSFVQKTGTLADPNGLVYRPVPADKTWATAKSYCPGGTKLVSCAPTFPSWSVQPDTSNTISWYPSADPVNDPPDTCSITMKQTGAQLWMFYVPVATCFDPML